MILPLSARGPLGRRNQYIVTPPQPGIPNVSPYQSSFANTESVGNHCHCHSDPRCSCLCLPILSVLETATRRPVVRFAICNSCNSTVIRHEPHATSSSRGMALRGHPRITDLYGTSKGRGVESGTSEEAIYRRRGV
jgi:hypothetical protein